MYVGVEYILRSNRRRHQQALQIPRDARLDFLQLLHEFAPQLPLRLSTLGALRHRGRRRHPAHIHILSVRIWPRARGRHQRPGSRFRGPRKEELHNLDLRVAIPRQFALAQARVEHVDGDGIRVGGPLGGHLADQEDFDELAGRIALGHVGGALFVQVVEDALGGGPFVEVDKVVHVAHDDGEGWPRVEFGGGVFELGEQEEGEEEGGDDVDGQGHLVVFGRVPGRLGDAGVLQEDIYSWEVFGRASGECFYAVVAAQIEGPDFNDAGGALGGCFNVFFRGLSFVGRSNGYYELRGAEFDNVTSGFQTYITSEINTFLGR